MWTMVRHELGEIVWLASVIGSLLGLSVSLGAAVALIV
jgi:hypothetical protein